MISDSHATDSKVCAGQEKEVVMRRAFRESFKGHYRYRPHFERLENRVLLASDTEPNNTTALANLFAANESIDGTVGT